MTAPMTPHERGQADARQRTGTPAPAVLSPADGWTDTPLDRGRLQAVAPGGDPEAAPVAEATQRAWDRAAEATTAAQVADQQARAAYDAACAHIATGQPVQPGNPGQQ